VHADIGGEAATARVQWIGGELIFRDGPIADPDSDLMARG
jgi:hypothetical protein